MHEFDEFWFDAGLRARARHWAFELRARGVGDLDADDVLAEAQRKVVAARRTRTDRVDNPRAYLRTAIDSVGRSLLRAARPTVPLEAADGVPAAALAADDPGFGEVRRRTAVDAALTVLHDERAEIWARAVQRLGAPERAGALWVAGVDAAGALLAADGERTVTEIIGDALAHDPYWRAAAPPDGELISPDTLRRRVDRARCWVTYVVLEAVLLVSVLGTCADPLVRAVTEAHLVDARRRRRQVPSPALDDHLAALEADLQGR